MCGECSKILNAPISVDGLCRDCHTRIVRGVVRELLEAAKMLADLDSVGYNPIGLAANGSGYPKAMRMLRSAIAKAEGKA